MRASPMGEALDEDTRLRLRGWLLYMWKLGRDGAFEGSKKAYASAVGVDGSTLSLYMKEDGNRFPGLRTVVGMRDLGRRMVDAGQKEDWPTSVDRLVDEDPPEVKIVTTPGAAPRHGAMAEERKTRGHK